MPTLDPHEAFGELRSALHDASTLSKPVQERLWQLITQMNTHHKAVYQAEWIPYLTQATSTSKQLTREARSVTQLRQHAALAPFAGLKLDLTTQPKQLEQFAEVLSSACASQLIALVSRVDDALAGQLAHAHMPNLKSMSLRALHVNDGTDGVQALLGSSLCACVETLKLRGPLFGDCALIELATSPYPVSLRDLDVAECTLSDDTFNALAASPHLVKLERLNLSQNSIGRARGLSLNHPETLPALRSLDLSYNELGPQAARALISSALLARLDTIELSDNRLGNLGARVLAASPSMAHFTRLNLYMNRISPQGIADLEASPHINAVIDDGAWFDGPPDYDDDDYMDQWEEFQGVSAWESE